MAARKKDTIVKINPPFTPDLVAKLMYFLGVLMILMGVYGFIRIAHVNLRHVPYPISGVLPSTIILQQPTNFTSHEADCDPYPQLYYDIDKEGKQITRPATESETALQDQLTKRCVNGFNEDRAKQEQRDKNDSAFLFFVGAGLIVSRRLIDSTV